MSFWVTLLYGILLVGLGYLGYHRSGSLPSLYSGVLLGICMIASSFAILKSPKKGTNIAVLLSLFLTALFLYRTVLTQKPIPILMVIVSAAVSALLIMRRPK